MCKKPFFMLLFLIPIAIPPQAQAFFNQCTVGEMQWIPFPYMKLSEYNREKWKLADGQKLDPNKYRALYEVIGFSYGGDFKGFNLPNLVGRVMVGAGENYLLAEEFGRRQIALTEQHLPAHEHANTETKYFVENNRAKLAGQQIMVTEAKPKEITKTTESTGNSQAFSNLQPYLTLVPIICADGEYPT